MLLSNEALSIEEWKALFEIAEKLKSLNLEEFIPNIFGLLISEEEVFHCWPTGSFDEGYAFGVYQGETGVVSIDNVEQASMEFISSGSENFDELPIMIHQDCTALVYGDRNKLSKDELDTIKSTGLKFRGKKAWPKLQNFKSGYVPIPVEPQEARLLLIAMQQTLILLEEILGENEGQLPEMNDIHFRVLENNQWRTEMEMESVDELINEPHLNEFQQAKLRKQNLPFQGVWQMEYLRLPPVYNHEGQRPFYPSAFPIVDEYSEFALGFEMIEPDKVQTDFIEMFIKVARRNGKFPEAIKTGNLILLDFLEPIAVTLDIEVIITDDLVELHDFLHSFEDYVDATDM